MQFFKVAALLALVSTGLAAPQPEAQDLAKRGFGCPDDGPCNTHVRSIFSCEVEAFTDILC